MFNAENVMDEETGQGVHAALCSQIPCPWGVTPRRVGAGLPYAVGEVK